MRPSHRSLGAFVLNSVVRPDWKQWFSRHDRLATGEARLAEMRRMGGKALALDEANALVDLFTTCHDFEQLSAVIKHIREHLQQELQPMHYHALMRLFNFSRDKDNFEQMLEVVMLRDKDDMDTYARALDHIHAAGQPDALLRMLEIVALTETTFGALRGTRDTQGTLVPAALPFATTEDGAAAPAAVPGAAGLLLDAPLLTSVGHHCCMTAAYDLMVPLVVLAWKCALGVTLADWDYVNLLSAVLSRADEYSAVASTIGVFDSCPPGHLSFDALYQRLDARRMLVGESAPLSLAIDAMRRSLVHHHVALDAVFPFPLANRRMYAVDGFLRLVLEAARRTPGVNQGAVYHSVVLMLCTLRHSAEGLQMAKEAVKLFKQSEDSASAADDEAAPEGAAAFRLTSDFAIDLAPALDVVSMHTHAAFANSFTDIVRLLDADLSHSDLTKCNALALTFLSTEHQIRDALPQVRELLGMKGHVGWATRNFVKHILRWCGRHPPRNCKLSRQALVEREKWAQYIAARDMALALFGSASKARDAMKSLFYNKLQLATVRDEASIQADLVACAAAVNVPLDAALAAPCPTRATVGGASLVPRHLHDLDMANPYPHAILCPFDTSQAYEPASDVFPELWDMMQKSFERDWYLRDTETYVLLMRCLIHRLDWDGCVDLTMQTVKASHYTALIDQELMSFFWEMGDPVGLLALKIATKIYDGRISVDVKGKREKFQDML